MKSQYLKLYALIMVSALSIAGVFAFLNQLGILSFSTVSGTQGATGLTTEQCTLLGGVMTDGECITLTEQCNYKPYWMARLHDKSTTTSSAFLAGTYYLYVNGNYVNSGTFTTDGVYTNASVDCNSKVKLEVIDTDAVQNSGDSTGVYGGSKEFTVYSKDNRVDDFEAFKRVPLQGRAYDQYNNNRTSTSGTWENMSVAFASAPTFSDAVAVSKDGNDEGYLEIRVYNSVSGDVRWGGPDTWIVVDRNITGWQEPIYKLDGRSISDSSDADYPWQDMGAAFDGFRYTTLVNDGYDKAAKIDTWFTRTKRKLEHNHLAQPLQDPINDITIGFVQAGYYLSKDGKTVLYDVCKDNTAASYVITPQVWKFDYS